MIEQKSIPQWKIEEVDKLVDLFSKYKTIAIIDVGKINDKQIQSTRKLLRGSSVIKMSKKNLLLRAIDKFAKKSEKKNLDSLKENLTGQSSLLFTNMDIFDLKRLLEENHWMVPAKPDEITPVDILVPEGDTGLPTGQVISELNMTLRLPTMLKNDTIWIREDKITHKAGDFVNVKQAAVLQKLGIKPIKSVIAIKFAWEEGEVIHKDVIYMDMEAFQQEFADSYVAAQHLAIELGIFDKETITPLIQKAYREGLSLLFESSIFDESMLKDYFKKAASSAAMLNAIVFGEKVAVSVTSTSEKKTEPEEEEEDEISGLGSLF